MFPWCCCGGHPWKQWDTWAEVSEDNRVDGQWSLHLFHFPISQSSFLKYSGVIEKRTKVQVAPAAIVSTGYNTYTAGHFASQINRDGLLSGRACSLHSSLASSRKNEKWSSEFARLWLNTWRFTPVVSAGRARRPVVVRLSGGEGEDASSEGCDSRVL